MVIKATMLDRALDMVIRTIRVGAASAPTTQDQIRNAVCNEAMIIADCSSALIVEMTDVTTAGFPATGAVCVDRGASVAPVINFATGNRGSIMYARACVVTDPLTPFLGFALAMPRDSNGGYYLLASSAFVNEPGG